MQSTITYKRNSVLYAIEEQAFQPGCNNLDTITFMSAQFSLSFFIFSSVPQSAVPDTLSQDDFQQIQIRHAP